jgi:hypothetical protein
MFLCDHKSPCTGITFSNFTNQQSPNAAAVLKEIPLYLQVFIKGLTTKPSPPFTYSIGDMYGTVEQPMTPKLSLGSEPNPTSAPTHDL